MWPRREAGTVRVFILVKTYPTPSTSHSETVCTAGITPDGRWIRLYPVPHRLLPDGSQYGKWQWIDVAINAKGANNDPRLESHKVDIFSIKTGESLDSQHDRQWKRRRALLDRLPHSTIRELEAAHEADKAAKRPWTSLGMVRPTSILDLTWEEEDERDWTREQIAKLSQTNLFARDDIQRLKKVPFKFRITYTCADHSEPYTTMIEDWEIGMLYFNCIWGGDSDAIALEKVKEKYLGDVLNQEKRDVRLLVGTRGVHPQWLIIGVYNPPRDPDAGQQSFLDPI
jgi:hypothetical protein